MGGSLADVDLALREGEMTVLARMSGSGKSTLMRAACGLVPHFFGGEMAGSVMVCGLDTREHGPAEVADVAAMVFQDPESQLVMNGVRAELALSLESRGHSGAGAARAVEEVALAFGIEGLLERPMRTLSGGELQRVALAAALVTRTPAASAGRAHLAARPRRRRRAAVAAAPPERGVGDDRAARRAAPRALPRGGRPSARLRSRDSGLRRFARRVSRVGRTASP